jgi:hypothetical protein
LRKHPSHLGQSPCIDGHRFEKLLVRAAHHDIIADVEFAGEVFESRDQFLQKWDVADACGFVVYVVLETD